MRTLSRIGFILLAISLGAGADGKPLFGALPGGWISQSEDGPNDEFVLYMTIDPGAIADRLPKGIQFRTLEDMASGVPGIAEYLKSHPDRSHWVRTYFEIIRSPHVDYDGFHPRYSERGYMAVWYAAAKPAQSDSRYRGYPQLALRTWISDPAFAAKLRSKGYPAEFAKLDFKESVDGIVAASLDATDLHVRGSCVRQGKAIVPNWAKAGSFDTIFSSAGEARAFEVVTYYGHHVQSCVRPMWRVDGTQAMARAFAARALGGEDISDTEFATGYMLKGALYRW